MSILTRIVSVCVSACVFLFVCVCAPLHICISVAAFQNNTKRRQRRGEQRERGREGGRRIGVSRIVARSFRAWQAGRKLYRLIDAKDVHNVQLGAECAGLRWQEETTKQQHTHTHTNTQVQARIQSRQRVDFKKPFTRLSSYTERKIEGNLIENKLKQLWK